MDISSAIDIPIPAAPLQPWLRLAHRTANALSGTGRSSRRRRLRDWELVFQCSGEMWWWWQPTGCSHALPAGWCACIPPGIEHAYAQPAGEHIAVHFDLHHVRGLVHPDMIESVGDPVPRDDGAAMPWFRVARPGDEAPLLIPAAQAVDARRFERRLSRVVELIQTLGAAALRTQLEAGAILLESLIELDRSRAAGSDQADERILRAIAAVPTTAAPSIASLARRCGLGESAFRSAFVRTTGETPHRFFERRRIDHALRLLRDTEAPIAAIAAASGYDDPFHFSRACKRVTGRPPSAWR